MADNTVTLIGIAGEPELRFTPSGTAMFKVGIGLYAGKNDDGTYKDSHWVNVVVWEDMAEHAAESIEKGDRIFVTGRIQQRRWTTEDGQNRSMLQVTADEIGVSLRWATAAINRVERQSSSASKPQVAQSVVPPDEAPF